MRRSKRYENVQGQLTEVTGLSGTPTVLVIVTVGLCVDVMSGFCVLVRVIVTTTVDVVRGSMRVKQETIEA